MKNIILIVLLFEQLNAGEIKKIFNSYQVRPGIESSIWGIKISYVNGEDIFSFNENKNLIPASILKIFITAAALDILGEDYKFKTKLYYTGKVENGVLNGDLIIKGEGDMTLGSENFGFNPQMLFKEWSQFLIKEGIKAINGNLIIDDSLLKEFQPGSWAWEDVGNYYAAPFTALAINDNMYKIFFRTGKKEGDKTEFLKLEPELVLNISNGVLTGPANSGDEAYVYSLPWSKEILIKGYLPAGKDSFFIKASVGDGALLCGELFFKYLLGDGFKIMGKLVKGKVPKEGAHFLYEMQSPPMSEIVKVINKKSFNFYAEMVLRFLPYKNSGKVGVKYGFEELNKFLEKIMVNTKDIYMVDSSGLSRLNAVKVSDFVKVLNYIYSQKYFKCFYDSLVFPGDSMAKGHVKKIGIGKKFLDNLRLKTGSLKNVRSYSGYLLTKRKKMISFCSMINNYSIEPQILDSIHEEIFFYLYENY